jgi:hypothetical protein
VDPWRPSCLERRDLGVNLCAFRPGATRQRQSRKAVQKAVESCPGSVGTEPVGLELVCRELWKGEVAVGEDDDLDPPIELTGRHGCGASRAARSTSTNRRTRRAGENWSRSWKQRSTRGDSSVSITALLTVTLLRPSTSCSMAGPSTVGAQNTNGGLHTLPESWPQHWNRHVRIDEPPIGKLRFGDGDLYRALCVACIYRQVISSPLDK